MPVKPAPILPLTYQDLSPYDNYCDGFYGGGYQLYNLGLVLATGVSKIKYNSRALDFINAFDLAEVQDTYLGQINMVTVSSFCGPQGLVWGYDIAQVENLRVKHKLAPDTVEQGKKKIKVYDLKPLLNATKAIFGTVKEKRFPLIPGSHVPCATNNIKMEGPTHIYASVAIGIPVDRKKSACLLMENVGSWEGKLSEAEILKKRKTCLADLAKSITDIGNNQNITYSEIFVGMKDSFVDKWEVGCALVAAPYFNLAKKAIPDDDPRELIEIDLKKWESKVRKNFLCNLA